MKKMTVLITVVLILTISLGALVMTILSNDKHHLVALVLLNGHELVEVSDDAVIFITESKHVTIYSFRYGIREFKEGAY